MDYTLYDLIAVLIAKTNETGIPPNPNAINKDKSDEFEKAAKKLLCGKINLDKICSGDKKCINSQEFDAIIDYCEDMSDYIFSRTVLCQLDLLINIDSLISEYDFNKFETANDGSSSNKHFEHLNNNSNETGIIIIPKVPSLSNTIHLEKDGKGYDPSYKNSDYWYDDINNHFSNIIYINVSELKGFKINNVIIDIFKNHQREKIVIGMTPICNDKLSELMDAPLSQDKDGKQHFDVSRYLCPDKLTQTYLQCLDKAREQAVDILVAPEMLGSAKLCDADEYGYNMHLRDIKGRPPHLIVTPSFWNNKDNYISVYLKSGRFVGNQHKQYCFEYKQDGEVYAEDLRQAPKEILLIHIPGWGRIVFPICVDLLVPVYRDILSRILKADLIICPSYSAGTTQFGNASGTVRDFGTRLMWFNSCSALRDITDKPKNIGYISVPVSEPDNLDNLVHQLIPQCKGKCGSPCLFEATIYANSEHDRLCNDVDISHTSF